MDNISFNLTTYLLESPRVKVARLDTATHIGRVSYTNYVQYTVFVSAFNNHV